MAKNKTALRRVFKAPVELSEAVEEKVLFLSRCLVHLWNLAQTECEHRLAIAPNVRMAFAECWETGESVLCGDIAVTPVQAEELFANLGVSSISLNFWLTPIRRGSITLDDGQEVGLDNISSDLQREVLRKLAGSYASYFGLKKNQDFLAKAPGQKLEAWFQTMSWSSFQIKDGVLRVPGYNNARIEIPLKTATAGTTSKGDYLFQNIAGKKVVFVTLSRDRYSRQFELSLAVAKPLPKMKRLNRRKLFRAIDLGAGDLAVTDSDGSEYLIPTRRPDKIWLGKWVKLNLDPDDIAASGLEEGEGIEVFIPGPILNVEARMAGRVKGSRGWKRLANARRYMHARSREQKDSHQKKVADALVSGDVQCIVVGKTKIRLGLARTDNAVPAQHYGVQNTGYMFRMLLYLRNKAEERGIKLIELDDPHRRGDLDDPESKLFASRELLRQGLLETKSKIPFPRSFQRKKFKINFGQGVPKKVAS